ncbi:MAG: hypothetical protein M0Q91_05455 [Methanoregula sp.]|jgi:hypothetical protein|nr:hypothetical protein [Methanoregula sp.]
MRKEKRDKQRAEGFCKINAQCQDEDGCIPCDGGYECEHLRQTKKGERR